MPKNFQILLNTRLHKIPKAILEGQGLPASDSIVIDWDFYKPYGIPEKTYLDLMDSLCQTLPEEVEQVKAGYANKDCKKLIELIHKLKGGFCYFGVPRLQKATNELHDALKNLPTLGEASRFFENFYAETQALLQEYHSHRKQISSP